MLEPRTDHTYALKHKGRSHKQHLWRYRGPPIGNSYSMALSRPSGCRIARCFETSYLRDLVQYSAVDYRPTQFEARMARKTGEKSIVSWQNRQSERARQEKARQKSQKSQRQNKQNGPSRLVALPVIHPRLYLGNAFVSHAEMKQNDIGSVLVLGRLDVLHGVPTDIYVENQTFPDSRAGTYRQLASKIEALRKLLVREAEPGETRNVLVVCDQGVNRSVAVCVGYAALEGMNYLDTQNYISAQKGKWMSTGSP